MKDSKERTIRCFIALDIPSTVKAELAALQTTTDYIRWSSSQHLHMTLNFLGEVKVSDLSKVKEALEESIKACEPPPLKLTGVCVVKGNMIWVEVDDSEGKLAGMHNLFKQKLTKKGIGESDKNRPYQPHILLGRYTGEGELSEDDPAVQNIKNSFVVTPLEANTLSVFRSEPDSKGPNHHVIASYEIKQQGEYYMMIGDWHI